MIRDRRIDLLRITLTFFVVLTHVTYFLFIRNQEFISEVNFLFSYLRWTTPVFIMIAGSLNIPKSREVASSKFVNNKLKKLSIPLLIWTVIYILIDYAYVGGSMRSKLIDAFIRGNTPGGLWFLYMIAGMYIATPSIRYIIDSLEKKDLLTATLVLLIIPSIDSLFGNVSWGNLFLFKFIPYIGYYILGYLIGNDIIEIRLSTKIIVYGIIACGLITALLSEFMHFVGLERYSFLFLTRFSPAIMMMSIGVFILGLRANVPVNTSVMAIYMPEIYLVHMIFIYILGDLMPVAGRNSWSIFQILVTWLGVSILSAIVSYLIHHIRILKFLRL